jgi:ABC-type multidrug transport system ATPase subunit
MASTLTVGLAPDMTPLASGANSSELAIVTDHLTKRFGDRTAVEDLSLSVARGEVFGFLGPNGAGKTTTVRLLGTLIAASAP